jgi:hypothetical protein
MITSVGNIGIEGDELSPASIDDGWDVDQIQEGDIRELGTYGWESDRRTLVGIGPRRRRRSAPPKRRPIAAAPESQRMPLSEPPGPFIADDDEIPASFRRKKLGVWSVALPALLVVAAAAVLLLRGLGPDLGQRHAAVAPAAVRDNAGLVVKVEGADVHVYLDGEDHGAPPLLLMGLKPGPHSLAITGPKYVPFEQPIMLVQDHVSTIEPALSLAPSPEPSTDGKGERGRSTTPPPKRATAPAVASPADPAPTVSESGVPSTGAISITSNPPSNVVLDGRPIGRAPRVVDVAPGTHTLVFVHPVLGRQSVSVSVSAGKTASAAADF